MILAIEAAVAGGSLSLLSAQGHLTANWEGRSTVSRAEDLLPAIDDMLTGCGIIRSDIGTIAVAVGPGSFTGIRIGLATAIGLASGLGCSLVSVSVLRAMAASADADQLLVAVPMGRSAICIQYFSGKAPVAPADTVSEAQFSEIVSKSQETIVVHGSLAGHVEYWIKPVLLGNNLARHVGTYAMKHPSHTEPPVFIAKSF